MPHSSAAVTALPAYDVTFGGHTLAYLDVPYARTGIYHFAYKLMSHRVWWFAVSLTPLVPFVHMQVCAADSGFLYLDQYIVHSYFRHWYIFHPYAGFSVALN